MKVKQILKSVSLFAIFAVLSVINFSCSMSAPEETSTLSFSIPRSSFEKNVVEYDGQDFQIECILTGAVQVTQSQYLEHTRESVSFSFTEIPLNKQVFIEVKVYKIVQDEAKNIQSKYIVYKGKTSAILKEEPNKNIVNLTLNSFFDFEGQFKKVGLKTVIAKDTNIKINDDSAWNTYYFGDQNVNKGVFINGRNIQLSPYEIGMYEVTQELYSAIMKSNPSDFNGTYDKEAKDGEVQNLRPVEKVTWYNAIIFCNRLTQKVFGSSYCVYYKDEKLTEIFDKIVDNNTTVYIDTTKNGYRLPTEAEWEFAARGANMAGDQWKYVYSGINNAEGNLYYDNSKQGGAQFATSDNNLNTVSWNNNNSERKTHEVGLKDPNSIGLYDMSGNVCEWVYDWYVTDAKSGDIAGESVTKNPLGGTPDNPQYSEKVIRGGSYNSQPEDHAVSYRGTSMYASDNTGFRLARWLED